jgi:hypothetical protein
VALTDVNREERDGGMDRLVRWIWLMVFGIEMCRGRHVRKDDDWD